MSDVFDDVIDRQAPNDPSGGTAGSDTARIAAVIASDERFSYFGTAAFTMRCSGSTRRSSAACR
jgi:hypothetical protein